MKTIIQVWTHKCCNVDNLNFWGLGDMIKGTIGLYQLSKIKNYKFIVDYQLHTISNFLKDNTHEYSEFIRNNANNINLIYSENVENFIDTCNDNILYFFNNGYCNENIDEDTKIFMKNILSPNINFSLYLNSKINEIPYESYNIIHFRLGDDEIARKNNINYDNYLNILLNNRKDNDILICDSFTFKNEVKKLTNIFTFDINPIHIGYSKDVESLKDTLIDFYIMINSKEIKTFSVYGWISGFTFWISRIYDIPLTNMKK